MEESIYNLLPKVITPPKKSRLIYKSQIPGNLAPTGSTFGTHSKIIPIANLSGSYIIENSRYRSESGTLGKSKASKITQLEPISHKFMGNNSLSIWAKKGLVHKSVDSIHNHSNIKPTVPHFPQEKPIMGLKQSKNYIATNAIEAILANPLRKKSEPDWLKKQSYGQVPLYLSQIKEGLQEKYEQEQIRIQILKDEENNKIQKLNDEELNQLREGLKCKYDELNNAYQQQTHCRVFGTIGVKRRKETLEKQLNQLEQDMEKLNKQYVFVKH